MAGAPDEVPAAHAGWPQVNRFSTPTCSLATQICSLPGSPVSQRSHQLGKDTAPSSRSTPQLCVISRLMLAPVIPHSPCWWQHLAQDRHTEQQAKMTIFTQSGQEETAQPPPWLPLGARAQVSLTLKRKTHGSPGFGAAGSQGLAQGQQPTLKRRGCSADLTASLCPYSEASVLRFFLARRAEVPPLIRKALPSRDLGT